MKITNHDTLYNEAVSIIAQHDNVGYDYVISHYTERQIFAMCKEYNDERFDSMDTIRQWW